MCTTGKYGAVPLLQTQYVTEEVTFTVKDSVTEEVNPVARSLCACQLRGWDREAKRGLFFARLWCASAIRVKKEIQVARRHSRSVVAGLVVACREGCSLIKFFFFPSSALIPSVAHKEKSRKRIQLSNFNSKQHSSDSYIISFRQLTNNYTSRTRYTLAHSCLQLLSRGINQERREKRLSILYKQRRILRTKLPHAMEDERKLISSHARWGLEGAKIIEWNNWGNELQL